MRALIVIDVQNDYFPGGKFEQWNAEPVLGRVIEAVGLARARGVPVIIVQHVADPSQGIAPFFNDGSDGVRLHDRLMTAAPGAAVVVKRFADSFYRTDLESLLSRAGVTELLLCGMMTQNCVTHTALSKAAERYKVSVLADCCTSVSEMIHQIALHALSTRVSLTPAATALA
jgi:nicotinamidase-related amidase